MKIVIDVEGEDSTPVNPKDAAPREVKKFGEGLK